MQLCQILCSNSVVNRSKDHLIFCNKKWMGENLICLSVRVCRQPGSTVSHRVEIMSISLSVLCLKKKNVMQSNITCIKSIYDSVHLEYFTERKCIETMVCVDTFVVRFIAISWLLRIPDSSCLHSASKGTQLYHISLLKNNLSWKFILINKYSLADKFHIAKFFRSSFCIC